MLTGIVYFDSSIMLADGGGRFNEFVNYFTFEGDCFDVEEIGVRELWQTEAFCLGSVLFVWAVSPGSSV